MHFLELEVVEELLEEEMLVSSSNYWLMLIWMRLVIWVCSQWRMRKCLLVNGVFEGALGTLGLEVKALVDAMEVYDG
ncbi:hypothetical protein Tco_1468283 [Tanacetum coccineum]